MVLTACPASTTGSNEVSEIPALFAVGQVEEGIGAVRRIEDELVAAVVARRVIEEQGCRLDRHQADRLCAVTPDPERCSELHARPHLYKARCGRFPDPFGGPTRDAGGRAAPAPRNHRGEP